MPSEYTSNEATPIPFVGASSSCRGLCRDCFKTLRRLLSAALRAAGLLCLFVFAADVSNAAQLSLKQLDHTAWTNKDGAPVAVFAMAQAPDGKLWLGSQSGLYQFDGVHFTAFRPPPGDPELPFVVVSAIGIGKDGTVWVGGLQGGIAAIRGGHVTVYGPNEGFPASGGIPQGGIVQSPDGTEWAAVRGHLFRLDQDRWHEEAWSHQPKIDAIDQVFFDRSGVQWIAAGGLIYSRPNAAEPFALRATGSPEGNGLAEAPDGSLWAMLTEHLATPPIKVQQLTGSYGGAQRGTISVGDQTSLIDGDGSLWLTNDHGLKRFAPGKWPGVRENPDARAESYNYVDGLSADSITSLFRDQEGSIWVGTSKGLDRFKRPALVRYLDTPFTGNALLTSCPNGDLWVASRDSPLISIHNGVTVPHGYNRWITSLFCDRDGVLWFGEQNGIWQYAADKLTYIPYPSDFPRLAARQMSGDTDRMFVAIRRTGIWTLANGTWTKFPIAGFPDDTAYAVLKGPNGDLWVGYDRGRVVHLDNGREQILHTEGNTGLGMIQILKRSRRGLLAGGTNGLAILRGDTFQTLHSADPAATQGVSGLQESSNGDLWINGAHGIFRIGSREVDAALKSPDYRMWTESPLLDGGPVGPAWQGGYGPTLAMDERGKLWFANIDQVVSFDPLEQPSRGIPLAVEITATSQDGILHEAQNPLRIPRVHNLRIGYLAVDLASPERLKYRYRLDGEDKAWQEAGTRTEAGYTNLSPGSYTFHAAASNDGQVWRESVTPLTIRILPSFYETTWFLVLCLSLAAALLWMAISMRIASVSARIRERSEERANERVQIARDLHDTLLQGIQGLMLRFHFAAQKVPGGEVRAMLDDALSSADNILQEGRERVTHLRASPATRADLLKSLEMVGRGLSWNNDTAFVIQAEGTPRTLRPAVHEELFYIGRESLNNAFRHAQAQRIEVLIKYGPSELRLISRDDGCGMDAKLIEEGRSGHWGLPGMRERATRIGATLECRSAPGAGTEIIIIISARRGYAPAQRRVWLQNLAHRIGRKRPRE